MKKKLSNVEIEERKKQNILESAKMNSCISGIALSDITQSGIQRGNYGEKDCLIKQQFLKNLVEPVTSRELYETLKRQNYTGNYNTFRGLLFRYQKYGYVQKMNNKKPFMYQLTDTGYQHAKNPYLSRELMARNYLKHLYRNIEKELVNHPETLKSLVETITQMNIGSSNSNPVIVGAGSQYSSNDLGNEELKNELNAKIFSSDFWKNTDNDKLKTLVDRILNNSLTAEEREEFLLDALSEAVNSHKGSVIINKQYNSNPKSEGERKYYSILVNSINKPVTRSVYEAIPFRFIKVGSEIRLKSVSESGTYRNNNDAKELDFDYVNRTYFYNSMTIKSKPNPEKRELEFYYVGGHSKYEITTMSFTDYEKAKRKSSEKQTLKINVQKG